MFTGDRIESTNSGGGASLAMQQIFPLTAVRGHVRACEANELTNYALLTQEPKITQPTNDIYRYFGNVPPARLVDLAIPTDPAQWEPSRYREFIHERRRLLVARMNAVLASLSSEGAANVDAMNDSSEEERNQVEEDSTPYTVEGGSREPRFAGDFDVSVQNAYSLMVREILAFDANTTERSNAVYYSYGTLRRPSTRPFATLARRKSVLVWTIDAKVGQFHDPRGWCQDMSDLGKHGIGDAQFKIADSNDLDYAMSLIRQAYRLAVGE